MPPSHPTPTPLSRNPRLTPPRASTSLSPAIAADAAFASLGGLQAALVKALDRALASLATAAAVEGDAYAVAGVLLRLARLHAATAADTVVKQLAPAGALVQDKILTRLNEEGGLAAVRMAAAALQLAAAGNAAISRAIVTYVPPPPASIRGALEGIRP